MKSDVTVVKMVEIYPCKWQIIGPKGNVLQSDINLEWHKAEDYVKSWVSSFHCWSYEMLPLPRNIRNEKK